MSKGDLARDSAITSRLEDPFVRRSLKTALHLRRYMPFYVFGLVWVLTLSLFPSIRSATSDDASLFAGTDLPSGSGGLAGSSDPGVLAATDAGAVDATGAPLDAGAATAAGGGRTGGAARTAGGATAAAGGAAAAAGAGAGPGVPGSIAESVALAHKTGKMRDGRDCNGQIRQLPVARYGAICTAKYEGPNGGATYHGVSGDKIRIVRRNFPDSANSQAVEAFASSAGLADEETTNRIRDEFIAKFDGIFELYGRKIEWIDYESQNGDATQESLGNGREEACADATYIKETLKAFAVYDGSAVFGECAAQRGMMVFSTGPYYPEVWYKKYHPYLWGGVMECERVSYQVSEYIGKRLAPYKSIFTDDPVLGNKERLFGTYVPDNDEYQHCVNITMRELDTKWGQKGKQREQYNYQLDVSRMADQAAQGILRFKAAGVTTVVLACDPISSVALMAAATNQAYYPEWYMIGTALNDTDFFARLFEPSQSRHLFGMSQLGSTDKLIGDKSEAGQVYKALTGKTIPEGTSGDYYGVLRAYSMLQGAGPI
ncbi:MAG TPA: hypothetical protein VFV66_28710, partial [Nonomuraea sp.]|nr:hypothetical protein [Nonomuraea sp.]